MAAKITPKLKQDALNKIEGIKKFIRTMLQLPVIH